LLVNGLEWLLSFADPSAKVHDMERDSRVEADFKDCSFVRGALVACGLSMVIWSMVWYLI
jgi:hypothetical protein